jgi:hypothetical protein
MRMSPAVRKVGEKIDAGLNIAHKIITVVGIPIIAIYLKGWNDWRESKDRSDAARDLIINGHEYRVNYLERETEALKRSYVWRPNEPNDSTGL